MPDQTIAQYEVLEKLGEGGMGIVYRARDTKLDRDVALKFLPARLAASEQDRARFVHEAKAAAALNHPNVCAIIDIQEHTPAGGSPEMFIVMEFVDGQTLRSKMDGIGLAKAVDIGIQIADGLSAAHEKGIVHRDVKPENVMIRKDGLVQIMDFGLAKLRSTGSRITQLTKAGSTVGTAGYMSPEQVRGEEADHRSDIFSLGVVLYELLTGERPFKGAHETALMYEIVNVDPAPMSAVRDGIDPELERIVLECLQKEPDERYNAVKDVAKELKRFKRESSRAHASRITAARPSLPGSGTRRPATARDAGGFPATVGDGGGRPGGTPAVSIRERAAWALAAISIAAALYLSFRSSGPGSDRMLVRTSIVTPESLYIHSFSVAAGPPVLSPDGRTVAFSGITPDGGKRIYVRPIDEPDVRPLPGTENGFGPFWSPDSREIGFFDGTRMRRIDLAGGSPLTMADVPNPRGATWNTNGAIVFTPDYQTPLFRMSDDGKGKPVQITTFDTSRREGSHRWPQFLPDGEHFLYLARSASESGDAEGDAIFVGSLDGSAPRLLVHSSYNPSYADGWLFFARDATLLAQRFDPGSMTLSGDPVIVQKGVLTDLSINMAVYTVSDAGALLFQMGQAAGGARPMFFDRTGAVVRIIEDGSEQDQVRYSPDGSKLAAYIYDMRTRLSNLWIYDLKSGDRRRLTTRARGDFNPVWSPDGSRIYFSSGGLQGGDLFVQPVARTGAGELLADLAFDENPTDILPDGSALFVEVSDSALVQRDIVLVSTVGERRTVTPFQRTSFDEHKARLSPDGEWVVFVSDESGQDEVYVKRFSAPESDPAKVSTGGGADPVWGPDSREIVYVNPRREFVSLKLRSAAVGLEPAEATRLFSVPPFATSYDISPDGTTFVVMRSLELRQFPPLSLVLNWDLLLR